MSRDEKVSAQLASVVPRERLLDEIQLHISLRLKPEDVVDLGARFYGLGAESTPSRHQLRKLASQIYEARRIRERMFSEDLFGEPAWDMLLALYFLPARGQRMTVTSVSHASCTSPTSGLRYQSKLEKLGFIERGPPSTDQRKRFIQLSQKGEALIETYLKRILSTHRMILSLLTLND